jgi:hypothetical protein
MVRRVGLACREGTHSCKGVVYYPVFEGPNLLRLWSLMGTRLREDLAFYLFQSAIGRVFLAATLSIPQFKGEKAQHCDQALRRRESSSSSSLRHPGGGPVSQEMLERKV